MRKHFVTFYSPGTLFSEETIRPIDSWDTKAAVEMSRSVTERHNARPFAFCFSTKLVSDPVPDGEGGMLNVTPKEAAKSGTYFLGGELLFVDKLKKLNNSEWQTLISNMDGSHPIAVRNYTPYRCTQWFEDGDFIVGPDGEIVERGDKPEYVEYRKRMIDEYHEELRKWVQENARLAKMK